MGAMVILTAYLLLKFGGILSPVVYFCVIPLLTVLIGKSTYLWFNMAFCGLLPFLTAAIIAFYLSLSFKID